MVFNSAFEKAITEMRAVRRSEGLRFPDDPEEHECGASEGVDLGSGLDITVKVIGEQRCVTCNYYEVQGDSTEDCEEWCINSLAINGPLNYDADDFGCTMHTHLDGGGDMNKPSSEKCRGHVSGSDSRMFPGHGIVAGSDEEIQMLRCIESACPTPPAVADCDASYGIWVHGGSEEGWANTLDHSALFISKSKFFVCMAANSLAMKSRHPYSTLTAKIIGPDGKPIDLDKMPVDIPADTSTNDLSKVAVQLAVACRLMIDFSVSRADSVPKVKAALAAYDALLKGNLQE